jgi:hypothetical protein
MSTAVTLVVSPVAPGRLVPPERRAPGVVILVRAAPAPGPAPPDGAAPVLEGSPGDDTIPALDGPTEDDATPALEGSPDGAAPVLEGSPREVAAPDLTPVASAAPPAPRAELGGASVALLPSKGTILETTGSLLETLIPYEFPFPPEDELPELPTGTSFGLYA